MTDIDGAGLRILVDEDARLAFSTKPMNPMPIHINSGKFLDESFLYDPFDARCPG